MRWEKQDDKRYRKIRELRTKTFAAINTHRQCKNPGQWISTKRIKETVTSVDYWFNDNDKQSL